CRGAADHVRRSGYSPGANCGGLLTGWVPLLARLPGVAPARLSELAQLHRVVEGVGGSAGFADRGAAESLMFPWDMMAGAEARVLPSEERHSIIGGAHHGEGRGRRHHHLQGCDQSRRAILYMAG